MTYFRFIYSDKKAYTFWITTAVVMLFFSVFSSLIRHQCITMFPLYVLAFILLIYIAYYSYDYYKYLKFYESKRILENQSIPCITGICEIDVFQENFTMKQFLGTSDIKVKVTPYRIDGQYIRTKDAIMIFYTTLELGVIKKHEKPICIKLSNKTPDYLKNFTHREVSSSNLISEENQIIINMSKAKLILIDFSIENIPVALQTNTMNNCL